MIPNPWIILGLVLAWFASLVAVGHWQHEDGMVDERVAWQGKENIELVRRANTIQRLNDEARASETAHAKALFRIGENHALEADRIRRETEGRVADAAAGRLRLRCPSTPAVPADPGGSAEASVASSGRNGSAGSELHPTAAATLLRIGGDADAVAAQLAACQAVIRADRQ